MKPTRRDLLRSAAALAASQALPSVFASAAPVPSTPLEEVGYSEVIVTSPPHRAQVENTHAVLMGLPEDGLLKPFRAMAGLPAPGEELGGWYTYKADYDFQHDSVGFAPGHAFGQWLSALARVQAASGDPATREKVLRLTQGLNACINTSFFEKTRFPAYTYEKLVCGLMDAHRLTHDPNALPTLARATDAVLPELPGRSVERDFKWRTGPERQDASWGWDESYTLPENLFLASTVGGGQRYRDMATAYLHDSAFFDPISRNENVLYNRHAYSTVNSMNSAMQAYFVNGSEKHLRAAQNGFRMIEEQSFATGGWGPDESLRGPGTSLLPALTSTHSSFETPCGAYGHMKLTRYLLRATRDGHYGDSMERVMLNTVLGAKALEADGHAFYYADYNEKARRVFHPQPWPCCSGTLPQVAADYGINSYLRSPGAVWVNLYLPSTLRWGQDGAEMSLTQDGSYPATSQVRMRVTASRATTFALNLRIPAWAEGASLRVNGKAATLMPSAGFHSVRRRWKTGDVVELDLPLRVRLQPIDAAHPEIAAVMAGPLVLFPLDPARPPVTRAEAMAAQQTGPAAWRIDTGGGPVELRPFTAVGDAEYSTYLHLS